MNRKIVFGSIIAVLLTVGIIAQASYTGEIVGVRGNYPVFIDGQQAEQDLSMVVIEGRIYLPLRALCDVLKMDIGWTEDNTVEVTTYKDDTFSLGYNGVDGRVTGKTYDNYELSAETACAIADDFYLQKFGEEYIKNNPEIKVHESKDKTCYVIYRHPLPPKAGGSLEIHIRKSDSKIMKVDLGE